MAQPQRIEPGPGQESVWDYPRPPRIEPATRRVRITFAGKEIVNTNRAVRVLETSGPPTYYIPRDDVKMEVLEPNDHATVCEWKGQASYFDLVSGDERSERAAWTYDAPKPEFESIAGYISFYPGRVEAAFLDDERVRPQPGRFYGGWVTDDIVGPFKGEPGSEGW